MTIFSRRLRYMLLYLLVLLTSVAVVTWISNPYGAWHTGLVDEVYRDVTTAGGEAGERIATAYRLRVERPTTLLVGSSRVLWGIPVEPGDRGGIFNASLCGASLPELTAILRLARTNPRLKRVVWGLDFYAFGKQFNSIRYPETRARLEGNDWEVMLLRVKDTLFSLQALEDSGKVLLRVAGLRKKVTSSIPAPWPETLIRERLDQLSQNRAGATGAASPGDLPATYQRYRLSAALLSRFRETVAGLREAGIDVVSVLLPLSHIELEVIEQDGQWETFQRWRRAVLAAGGPYWDFSGYNELAWDESLFRDAVHIQPAVGHVILRQMLGEDCAHCGETARRIRAAGVWVEATTIDQHLATQEADRSAQLQQRLGRGVSVECPIRFDGDDPARCEAAHSGRGKAERE